MNRLSVDYIMHGQLTGQGRPLTVQGWIDLFKAATFEVVRVIEAPWNQLRDIYFLKM